MKEIKYEGRKLDSANNLKREITEMEGALHFIFISRGVLYHLTLASIISIGFTLKDARVRGWYSVFLYVALFFLPAFSLLKAVIDYYRMKKNRR